MEETMVTRLSSPPKSETRCNSATGTDPNHRVTIWYRQVRPPATKPATSSSVTSAACSQRPAAKTKRASRPAPPGSSSGRWESEDHPPLQLQPWQRQELPAHRVAVEAGAASRATRLRQRDPRCGCDVGNGLMAHCTNCGSRGGFDVIGFRGRTSTRVLWICRRCSHWTEV